MKKTLVALAVLGSFAGIASAATSVTLYGQVEVGYHDFQGKSDFKKGAASKNPWVIAVQNKLDHSVAQYPRRSDRFGIKGQEDLGNGLAATFQLEGSLKADNGDTTAGQLFNRESTVGLKGAFGEAKLGRSKSQVELASGGLTGVHGVTDVDLYSVAMTRHSNGLFYEYKNSGFTFGADVTTKGGAANNDNEGVKDYKVGYGARLGYYGNGLLARVAYQDDGKVVGGANDGKKQQEWIGVLGYNLYEAYKIPLSIGASYAQGKGYASDFVAASGLLSGSEKKAYVMYADKARTISAIVRGYFTPNDSAYVLFQKRKGSVASTTIYDAWATGLGYEHKLSKRTAVFADAVYLKAKKVQTADVKGKAIGYSFGVAHSF